eukprot:CAMPEP_0179096568 /NCGR_PEP_ID=MMETSP0796-20121207/44402_1 /TAXON_ID=73915 /ORGANISM="Pyrodinium bahamense, Strain pbaha01" /LENGTH=268 /DNA_ID=CAMNT_0020794293 /DNA_START=53 /DNA_END=859 /DNA_ORIENTATION=-
MPQGARNMRAAMQIAKKRAVTQARAMKVAKPAKKVFNKASKKPAAVPASAMKVRKVVHKAEKKPTKKPAAANGARAASNDMKQQSIDDPASAPAPVQSYSWEGMRLGKMVIVDPDGHTVRNSGFNSGHLIVVGPAPSRSFRFRVVDNSFKWSGGVGMGFTASRPEALALPEYAYNMPLPWIIGNHGNLYVSDKDDNVSKQEVSKRCVTQAKWKAGNVVRVLANDVGRLQVIRNGKACFENEAGIPSDIEVYPVLDISGKTKAVQLLID